ncbi:hypothetical protein BGZ91_008000, partial [Linnemannia elongata]
PMEDATLSLPVFPRISLDRQYNRVLSPCLMEMTCPCPLTTLPCTSGIPTKMQLWALRSQLTLICHP